MSSEYVAGIDPGKTGGFGIFELGTGNLVSAGPLIFDNPLDLYDRLSKFDVTEILIERAQAAKGDAGQFEYGRSFGRTEAAAMLTGAQVHYCSPVWWKSRLNITTDKEQAYREACRRWPSLEWFAPPGPRGGLDKVHGVAEGCLIGSCLLSKKLYAEIGKNNAARIAKSERRKRKPRFDWRGD